MASELTLGDLLGKHTDVSFDEAEPVINRRSAILGVAILLMITSWFCTLFRLYTRFFVARSPGWDDLFVGIYLMTTTVSGITVCIAPDYGLGRHLLTLTYAEFTNFLHIFYFMNASYLTSTALIKLSLLFQFLRLFPKGSFCRRACIVLLVITGLWGVAYMFIGWFPCFPVNDYWENPTGNTCYGYGVGMTHPDTFAATFESHAATNTALDVFILALPFPLLRDKQTNRRTRLGIAGLLAIGVVVNSFSIWRLVSVVEHKAGMYPAQDPTWYGPISIILAILEVDIAAMCASIPIFWPVIEDHFGKIFVTQEVKITSEDRWNPGFMDDQSEAELTSHPSEQRGRNDSNGDVKLENLQRVASGKDRYYDEFMMGQIDPLNTASTKAVIQSQKMGRRKWWRLV